MAASLALFQNDQAVSDLDDGRFFCQSNPINPQCSRRDWRVARSSSGRAALFDGWFDNLEAIADELCVPPRNPAEVFAEAVDRWRDEADRRVIGCYSAIVASPDGSVRLSRSPIRATPLSYCIIDGVLIAASLPRVLIAAGLPATLSERKLADSLFLNLTGSDGWYEGSKRLEVGCLVHYRPSLGLSQPFAYYDVLGMGSLPNATDAEYLEEAERLLREAARCSVRGAKRPGVFLSGGLDSSNVAARVLDVLPQEQRLPSFTFMPTEAWDGFESETTFGNERPFVEAFAGLHERIEPHFIDNVGRIFDHGLDKLFLAIGTAPGGLCNVWMHHGIYEAAQAEGCDLLLSSDLGNQTFSAEGDWATTEYFLRGRWRQVWLALKKLPSRKRSIWRSFLTRCIGTLLSDSSWRAWQIIKGEKEPSPNEVIASLRADTIERYDMIRRAAESGVLYDRPVSGSRRRYLADAFARGDCESGEVELGFAQVYGIRCRDVTAYRPFVEFCLGLPTRMFMRDGESRWLARQLGKGRIPEKQRLEKRYGDHHADWHARMTPHLEELRSEIRRASANAFLANIVDYGNVLRNIDEWPEHSRFNSATTYRCVMGIPRVVLASRFAKYVNRWNDY